MTYLGNGVIQGRDVYTEMAKLLFGGEVTRQTRSAAKVIMFSLASDSARMNEFSGAVQLLHDHLRENLN